ncbi:MAG: succinate dehydrogenase, hydrophobic membrane anchor protein [Alphaproteobacteria bacterium]|nr:succinate dehydrogenase, hydrophobic membrane anchor protein [Alphaproteobacteria bacterium]MBU1514706.1 succinate dehydrogenase, hydrophobic membrane anchor protein [Alphaproteobacteria bacterium]MBU2093565.1 succinate dehydrogenase, hydrophobic membrane anchor protein [Alphaproteobacteria bacterium]MBU2149479.1 succinate dehydrogenase, hydrophobic membrane anchor protein [Alphaproteobacteria bacterium]MBU2305478.1 succinate dehydrogenase, hydrophobic membrane anchor protein [Alphaproteobac
MANQQFRTPRSIATGLGSAHHGVHHFLVERVSALALVPLVLWGAFAAVGLVGAGHEGVVDWIAHPINGVLTGALLICGLIHAKNAMQVVIEDYIYGFVAKAALLLLNLTVCSLAGALGVFAILKAALTGGF